MAITDNLAFCPSDFELSLTGEIVRIMNDETLFSEPLVAAAWKAMRTRSPMVEPGYGTEKVSLLFRSVPIACIVIGSLAVLMRLFVKIWIMKVVHVEDWLVLFAWLMFIPWSWLHLSMAFSPLNFDQYHVTIQDIEHALLITYVAMTLGACIILLLKSAIILQILRVFVAPGSRNMVFWVLHIAMWIGGLIYVVTALIDRLSCNPVQYYWKFSGGPGRCFNTDVIQICNAAINAGTDVVIFIAPQWVIWTLFISDWRKRLRLACVFCFGLIAMSSSFVRLYCAIQLTRSFDKIYWIARFMLIASVEGMAGCLIIALPLAPKFTNFVLETWRKKTPMGHDSYQTSTELHCTPSERYLRADESGHDIRQSSNAARTPSRDTGQSMA